MFRSVPMNGEMEILPVADVTLYSTAVCPYCVAAKNFLKSRGIGWTEVRIDTDPEARKALMERTRRTSVPQIFINDTHVGGFEELVGLDRRGELNALLEAAK